MFVDMRYPWSFGFGFKFFVLVLTSMPYLPTLRKTSGGISLAATLVTFRIISLNVIFFISWISVSLNLRNLQEKIYICQWFIYNKHVTLFRNVKYKIAYITALSDELVGCLFKERNYAHRGGIINRKPEATACSFHTAIRSYINRWAVQIL